jgi:hypothetical protein
MSRAPRDKGIDLATAKLFVEHSHAIAQGMADRYREGWDAGYAAGVKAGKRLAKGKPEFAKAHGRQKGLEDLLALQFVDLVDSLINNRGVSLGAAVAKYHKVMTLAWKDFNEGPPSEDALIRLYQRIKKGKHKIDPSVRRAYEMMQKGDRSST